MIEQDAFIEWEEVYPDQYYGTLFSELDKIWKKGKHAIFDIDVQGGINLKKKYGDRACSIFVRPPSMDVLEQRLRTRGTDNESSLQLRLGKARYEMTHASHFDHIIVNDTLEHALAHAGKLVKEFLDQ